MPISSYDEATGVLMQRLKEGGPARASEAHWWSMGEWGEGRSPPWSHGVEISQGGWQPSLGEVCLQGGKHAAQMLSFNADLRHLTH